MYATMAIANICCVVGKLNFMEFSFEMFDLIGTVYTSIIL